MFVTKNALPRRTFLQGVGVTLALPFLDAMVPATRLSAASARPLRFGAVYVPHGFVMDQWIPDEVGPDFAFKRIMKSLEPFRDHVVAVSNLDGCKQGDNGVHATSPGSFLTGVVPKPTEGVDIYNNISIDQVIAKHIGQDTSFPSLELTTADIPGSVGACNTHYSCAYMDTISWASATSPLPMERNPRVVFERIFGGAGTLEERLARYKQNRSILDAVMVRAKKLQGSLGATDRTRLNDYLDNIREIERRIHNAEKKSASTVEEPTLPAAVPFDIGEHIGLLYDLLLVAWQADLTRVGTFMLARDQHGRSYPEVGAPAQHHVLSHHSMKPEPMAQFAAVNAYHTQLTAKFVEKLRATPDGDGTLLDHSMIMYGSGLGWGHNYKNIPLVVIGGANGSIKGNRHVTNPNDTSHANLHLALAQKAGVPIEKYGLSTGAVDL